MPAAGFGSKYVVFGGITSPASATSLSASISGGARVKSAPPSTSHRRVSSTTEVPDGHGLDGAGAGQPVQDPGLEDGDVEPGGAGRTVGQVRHVVPAAVDVQADRAGPGGRLPGDRPYLEVRGQQAEQGLRRPRRRTPGGGTRRAAARPSGGRRPAGRRRRACRPAATPRAGPRPGGGRRRCRSRPRPAPRSGPRSWGPPPAATPSAGAREDRRSPGSAASAGPPRSSA